MQKALSPLPGAYIYGHELRPGDTAYKPGGTHPYVISSRHHSHAGWSGEIEGVSLISGSRTQFSPNKPCVRAHLMYVERPGATPAPGDRQQQLPFAPPPSKLDILKKAASDKRKVAFEYWGQDGRTRREFFPHEIDSRKEAWVSGWCLLRKAPRRFALDRMHDLTLPEIANGTTPTNLNQAVMSKLETGACNLTEFADGPLWGAVVSLQKSNHVTLFFGQDGQVMVAMS